MSTVGGSSSKSDGRVVEGIQFCKGGFCGVLVDDITIVESGKKARFENGYSGGVSEAEFVSVKKTKLGFDMCLKFTDVSVEAEGVV